MTVKTFDKGEYVEINNIISEIDPCRVCGKHPYRIKIDNNPNKEKLANPNWVKNWNGIPVDYCIGKEVEWLINQGVVTKGCCCGHEQYEPTCLILKESIELVKQLGYEPYYYDFEDIWEIKLKNNQIGS